MSPSQESHPVAWGDEEYQNFGKVPEVSRHRCHKLALFETAALIALLDEYPRKHLQVDTMGINKIKPFKRRERSASNITDLQLDPDGPLGLRKHSVPRLAFFARKTAQHQDTTRDIGGSAN